MEERPAAIDAAGRSIIRRTVAFDGLSSRSMCILGVQAKARFLHINAYRVITNRPRSSGGMRHESHYGRAIADDIREHKVRMFHRSCTSESGDAPVESGAKVQVGSMPCIQWFEMADLTTRPTDR
jgi:hypothetical protein